MEVSKEHANGGHHKRAGTVIGILEPNPLVEVEDQCSLAKHRIFLRIRQDTVILSTIERLTRAIGLFFAPKVARFHGRENIRG
jgi:hypothetical protein